MEVTDDGLGHRGFFTEDQRAASTPIASSEELNLKQQRELQLAISSGERNELGELL